MRGWLIGLLMLAGLGAPAVAAEPSPQLKHRADELVLVLRGEEPAEAFFSPAFLAQIPPARVKAIAEQLAARYGAPTGVAALEGASATAGTVTVDFPKGTARMDVVLDPAAPHLVTGLLIAAVEAKAETLDGLATAFRALPGRVSIAAARLDDQPRRLALGLAEEQPLAVGSDFKLFILAELVRAVHAGERQWSDVVPLSARSLPSGFLQSWPKGAPLTLHTLAALMISQSDNSAADTLLATLGRTKVERLLPELGVRRSELDRPFLSTREAFLLKGGAPERLARWKAGHEAERRAVLATLAGADLSALDLRRFAGAPIAIETVEWFASAGDLVRTLDWIRRSGDRTAMDILAINPGLPDARRGFTYMGYKGGSESGVIAMAFLLRRKDGGWAAAAAVWNDSAAPVDDARFAALTSRLLTLLR